MRLRLNETLKMNACCLVRRILPQILKRAKSEGIWVLSTEGDDRRVWEGLYIGDHVIIWDQVGNTFHLLAAIVLGKSLDLNVPKSERPLRLILNVQGASRSEKIPFHGYNSRSDLFCPQPEFKELWGICDVLDATKPKEFDPFFYEWEGFSIRVASSQSDFEYIEIFAKTHSFGYRKAYVTFIAYYSGKRVGAILAEPSYTIKYPHTTTARLFGSDYEFLRFDSLSIKRIFASSESQNKMKVHEALLRGLIEVAPFLVERPIRILEAVSYDYHPLSDKLGFHAELPDSPTGSIYYWKPFNISKDYIENRISTGYELKHAVHAFIESRNNLRFFCVYASIQNIRRSMREKAWAVKNSLKNRGVWKSLSRGDIVFFIRDRQFLEGYARVERTRFDETLGDYPLRIDFNYFDVPYVSVDLTLDPLSVWNEFRSDRGIFILQNLSGSKLKEIVDRRQSEDKMWVKPNAYLLPGTEFVQIPKQIFVIQAWVLKDSILPTIRDIFHSNGYTVTHADDREGQIIFGDIWKLMNEAQIVLVDFTDKRPNVYLEYGMALVLGKPIIAISQRLDDLPSDTPQLKTIIYEDSMPGTRALTDKLIRAVADRLDDLARANALRP